MPPRSTPALAAPKVDIQELLRAEEAAEPELPSIADTYAPVATPILGTREAWDEQRTLPLIAGRLRLVVAEEGPIHLDEAARRVGASWDSARASKGNVTKLVRAMALIPVHERPARHGDFLWPAGVQPAAWPRFRVPANEATRVAAEYLAPQEIANAAEWVISRSGSISVDELVTELARLFGFRSTGKNVRAAMESGIAHLVDTGRARLDDGTVAPAR